MLAPACFRTALPLLAITCFAAPACVIAGDGDGTDGAGGHQTGQQPGTGGSSGIIQPGANEQAGASGAAGTSGAAGSAGAAGQGLPGEPGGAAGQGGAATQPVPPGPPEVASVTPESGAFGTLITIQGSFLGSGSRSGSQLHIGNSPAFTILSNDDAFVDSWTEDEVRFRYPFPAAGQIRVETPQGTATAGEFNSSWVVQVSASSAPAASVIASLSAAPATVSLLFDSVPPVLLDIGPGLGATGTITHQVTLNGAVSSSVRLYLASGTIEGIGVTSGADPELVHLANIDGNLVGELTGIQLDATESALAGGPDGACAWLHRSDGWWRARPLSGEWSLDAGPIADVQTGSPDRAVGAASDGSLYVAWSVDAGNVFDDMEAPRMRRLSASGLTWGASEAAGSAVDDYITSLEVIDKGRGVVVRYCGSDSDPWGASGTAYRCYDGLHTPAGAAISRVSVDVTASRHAFSAARAVAGYCDDANTFRLRTDTDVEPTPGAPIGEAIAYPCQTTLALEIDPDGDFVPVVKRGPLLHLLGRRPAP